MQLSRRILVRYYLIFFILMVMMVGALFLGQFVCSLFTWQQTSTLYQILILIRSLAPFLMISVFAVGLIIISILASRKIISYLDEVVDAVKSVSSPDDDVIELSEELIDIQNELHLAREQALKNARLLSESEKRKNDLVMYLAHDLKTPLASVIGYLNLLHDEGQISEELREKYLAVSLSKAERLEDLINEFFEIARFNLTDITLIKNKINLSLLLEQLTYEFKPMLSEKKLTCNVYAEKDITVHCDADKIQRVFDNLLRNAVIYSYPDSEIIISADCFNSELIVRFINHGDTIPQEKIDRIFEQFYRLDAARRSSSGGAGLGLAIAKQIVELHGGEILVKSENELTEFAVVIPVS